VLLKMQEPSEKINGMFMLEVVKLCLKKLYLLNKVDAYHGKCKK